MSNWYAARTRSRHEKFVAHQLTLHAITAYVPTVRRKSPNRTMVEAVLLPGYCFVEIDRHQESAVCHTVGVCGFVTFQNEPAEVMQAEIDVLKQATEARFMAREHVGFLPRQAVKIVGTPFDGYIATVDYVSGNRVRVILPMSIGRSVSVEILAENVEPLPTTNRPTLVEIPCGIH